MAVAYHTISMGNKKNTLPHHTKKLNLSDKVVEYILKSSDEELAILTVDRIAQKFKISQSFLCRKFRAEKYFTIGKFIFKERMFRAAQMLTEDQKITIKSLSEIMGFFDYDYFIRIFKKHFGISPSRYRDCVLKKTGH